MSVAAKTREGTASVTREHKFIGGNRGNLEFRWHSTPPVREKTGEYTIDKRRETTWDCRSCAVHLASLSTVSFPGRNKCPGTHCSLIVQEAREIQLNSELKIAKSSL